MPTVVQQQVADQTGVRGPITFLQGAQAAATSAWFPLSGIRPWSVTVRWNGAGSFIARLHVSNDPHPTNGDTTEPQLDVDVTASTALSFDSGFQSAMLELVSASGGAVVSAFLLVG